MADVSGKFFSAVKVRTGVSPSSPGVEVGETLPPVNPPGGGLNSVGLTMPSAFAVANSPLTSNGTLEVTGAGTTAQYIRGDGSLASFPSLTGYVPYTGATADVNLGTHDLTAERGTFQNNGSSDTLTVNHTSGSGYGIKVTKGGNGEALYVSKTSGSGNAMAVVGGRTALVDLSLSSVSNATGNFLTISGGVVHQRTASETRSDVGAQAQLNGTGFVKASGTTISYDNTSYLPLTGGTLTGPLSVTGNITLIAGGSGSSFNREISLGSGTAYNYQVRANDDDFHLIESGSHVFLAYTYGGSLGTGTIRLYNNTISTASFTSSSFIRSGGTSSQYLMADGSVSTLSNPVTGTGTSGQVAYWNGTNSITSDSDLLFDGNNLTVGGNITLTNVANRYLRIGSSTAYFYDLQSVGDDFQIREAGTTPRLTFSFPTGNATFSSSVTATSIIRSGGTSAQFLKADGSVDSTSYVPVGRTITINGTTQDLSANRTFNVGTVTSVTATSPLFSSGGATPNITIQQASGSQNGFLSSTDWTTFNNKANVGDFVTLDTTQTITASKTFSLDIIVNGLNVGRGPGNFITSTRLGVGALQSNTTGEQNTAVGESSLISNTTGSNNASFGRMSLFSNTTGSANTAIGTAALNSNTTGIYNSGFGFAALGNNLTGNYNTSVGIFAGTSTNGGSNNTTPSDSVYIGYDTRASLSNNNNEIVIGSGGRGQGSNSAVIGNSNITKTVLRGNVLIGTTTDFGVSLAIGGNIIMPTGANREIFMGSASAYNYRIRVTGDDFIINEANSVDRLKYVYADTRWYITGGLTISGSLSKGSGSFKIDHPLPAKKDTHHLVHSFIEGPQADNIYRGKVQLVNGKAQVNIDYASGMSKGTFVLLNGNVQCFTSNESGWIAIKGTIEENILKIEAENSNCNDLISWLVVGERHDQHMIDTDWTDKNGKVIVEPQKK
jgi:hypothetical protein